MPVPLPLLVASAAAAVVFGKPALVLIRGTLAIAEGPLALDPDQLRMKQLIETHFAESGLGFLAGAAVANAWAESRLRPDAVGDGGASVGLFQLNDGSPAAAGYGMSVSARKNPDTNTQRIIDVARATGAELQDGQPGWALTWWFAKFVERCAACGHNAGSSELWGRVGHYARLYGMSALMGEN